MTQPVLDLDLGCVSQAKSSAALQVTDFDLDKIIACTRSNCYSEGTPDMTTENQLYLRNIINKFVIAAGAQNRR